MLSVTPVLHLEMAGDRMRLEVQVASAAPRSLEWRLTVRSKSAGGESSTTQAGGTDGRSSAPLAAVTLNARATGRAVLVVREKGVVVAEKSCRFGAPADQDPSEPAC